MRLLSIELQGFRGFAKTQRFDFNSDVVIIVGSNGQGKTSLFDAVMWALTGSIPRIKGGDAKITSMYSETGTTRVILELKEGTGDVLRITRSFDGQVQQVRVDRNGQSFRGEIARSRILEAIWPEALSTANGSDAITSALTRSVYLQQDLVREFIESTSDQDRFSAVSELVGVGRITELQVGLERARLAWTKATNIRAKDLESLRARFAQRQEQLRRLSQLQEQSLNADDISAEWEGWISALRKFKVEFPPVNSWSSSETPRVIENSLKQLDGFYSVRRRRLEAMNVFAVFLQQSPVKPFVDIAELKADLQKKITSRDEARGRLRIAEGRANEIRHAQVALREARAQARALAQLALQQLGDVCPVCTQTYDRDKTRTLLQQIIADVQNGMEGIPLVSSEEIEEVNKAVSEIELAVSGAEVTLRRSEQEMAAWQSWVTEKERRMKDLEIADDKDDLNSKLDATIQLLGKELSEIEAFRQLGERLTLSITRSAELSRRAELEREVDLLQKELGEVESQINSRSKTSGLADSMIDALRGAASDVVQDRLARIEPLLQRLYGGIDPHPSFRVVKLFSKFTRGRGHLAASLFDDEVNVTTDSPAAVLSSSQMNALAVAVFLAFNLGIPRPPLQAALLDDPLQSLDDVNLLGLIDLLRRVKDERQLIISTHDVRFGRLLERKLRPATDAQRTSVIELVSWGREGQVVRQRDVPADPLPPLRIVA